MTIEQIHHILTIYETGSLSQAADKLFMSRSNLSKEIKKAEQELGFDILDRNTAGVTFTRKGAQAIDRFRAIVKEMDSVQALARDEDQLNFSMVTPYWAPADDAFVRLCGEMQQRPRMRITLYHEQQYEAMKLLTLRKADLAVVISHTMHTAAIQKELADAGLSYTGLRRMCFNVNLSEHHPLLQGEFQKERLRDYPYAVTFVDGPRGSQFSRLHGVEFVNLSRTFRIAVAPVKNRIIGATEAYGIGAPMPESWYREYGLRHVPLPEVKVELGYIRRASDPVSEIEARYLELLEQQLEPLDRLHQMEKL